MAEAFSQSRPDREQWSKGRPANGYWLQQMDAGLVVFWRCRKWGTLRDQGSFRGNPGTIWRD